MSGLEELSWEELVDRLRALQERAAATDTGQNAARLVHELHVHQIELEMQNRELREAQQRIELSRARYAELYDRAPVGYVTMDPKGVILEINLTAAALFGREREQLVGLPFIAAANIMNPPAFFAHLRECAVNEKTARDVELEASRGKRVLRLTTTPNIAGGRQVVGFRTMIADVSEHRRAEADRAQLEDERHARAEADAANRMKDQFLGIVSHELRSPLSAILGWANLMSARSSEPELLVRGLQVMRRNGQALARIVDDILDVSRIVSGKLHIELKKTDAHEVVQTALELARAAARKKNIELRESIQRNSLVVGDAVRLQQVVSNLLSNALKFTRDGGHVEVSLGRHDGNVRLTVRDDGVGIDAADLPHVFEHFRQADSSATRSHAGLGLGLAIARHIVEAHGGTIEAHSDGRGRGALFTVDLPTRVASTSSAPPPRHAPRPIAGIKVLYVDDEPDALELAALTLGAQGAEVRTASSVDAAIELLSSFTPDVVVSDIAMPDLDGYDFIRRLREMPLPWSDIPAVALTAYARATDAERALRAGFTRHLAKPVEPDALAGVISTIVPEQA
jgi:PAS domain S-box-containing protein